MQRFVAAVRDVGFQSTGVTPNGHQHRWVRGEAQIDILIPSGLDPSRSDGNRREPGRVTTIESRGLQFAIGRTRRMPVTINGRAATINAPDLIGAIYGKCSALLNHLDRNVERHLGDIVLLASVVDRGDRRELGSLPQRAGTTPGRLMARDRGSAPQTTHRRRDARAGTRSTDNRRVPLGDWDRDSLMAPAPSTELSFRPQSCESGESAGSSVTALLDRWLLQAVCSP